MTETTQLESLATRAMAMILPCGDARALIHQALDTANDGDPDRARAILADAKAKTTIAHRAQTSIVQSEAQGEQQPYSILFSHAQDILMTVMSELSLAGRLIDIVERVDQRLVALEAGR